MEQTIFALSTGQVKAAVAIIRVSGPLAWAVSRMFCKKNLSPRRAELVDFFDPETSEYLDVGLVIWFPGPHSYTGEDVVEFQLHGSSAVTSALLSALSGVSGLRLAEVGEFTRRAFQNDKMSLDTVEGLADLLEADTQYERRQALHRMQGNFGNVADIWRLNLVEVRALIEASLDFTEEADVPQDIIAEVIDRLRSMTASVSAAIKKARRQEILRGGFLVLIAGPPNVGKSTLLNYLVQREVAITSQFAGTTRDLIEVPLNLGGMRVVLVDSAGLRETDDPIEKIGLSKAALCAREADLILWLSDETQQAPSIEFLAGSSAKLLVVNGKCDLSPGPYAGLPISAVTGSGIAALLDIISEEAKLFFSRFEGGPVIRHRQLLVAESLLENLENSITHATTGALELCAEDLALGTRRLSALVEVTTSDEVLDEVFHRFCLGK